MMRTFLALFLQELYRPRHVRPDPLAGLTVPAPIEPTWYPVADKQRARDEKRLAAARRNREASLDAWFGRRMDEDGLRACEGSYRETVREVSR